MPFKHRLAFAFLYSEELIELVDLRTDILTGLKAHHDELAILRRIQDCAERLVLLRCLFDVVDIAFHSFLHSILALLFRLRGMLISRPLSVRSPGRGDG